MTSPVEKQFAVVTSPPSYPSCSSGIFLASRGTERYGPTSHDPLAHVGFSVPSVCDTDLRSLASYCFRLEIGTYPALSWALGAFIAYNGYNSRADHGLFNCDYI